MTDVRRVTGAVNITLLLLTIPHIKSHTRFWLLVELADGETTTQVNVSKDMADSTRGPNLGHLLKSGQFSDLTLVCRDQEFNVHKAVVCAQSQVLAAAIREPFQVRCLCCP